jgi:arabinose-5-phosphate isomerase
MDYAARAREVLDIEIEELRQARDRLAQEFDQAVVLLLDRLAGGGKIVVTGVGKSFHVGQKISATLASTGSTSVALHPSQAAHGDLGIFHARDTLLAISLSGESEELLAILPVLKRLGVAIVAFTGDPESTLARHSDAVIPVGVGREACPFNLAPTASTTVAMAVGDALAVVLLEARGFTREDYARFHPGGAIGRTLLVRVADIMRRGERLAAVPEHARVKEAVLAMTSARAGCVGVVDAQGRLRGIFTDGDLRRLLAAPGGEVSERPIREVMTTSPVTVAQENLAVQVLRMFEEHHIDDILVVDGEQRLVGLVDIQDLPRFKIL